MFLCLCHALVYTLFHHPWHVMFTLCFVAFFKDVFVFLLSFIFSFILHPSCIIFYPCSYLLFFPYFLLIHLFICDKKWESIPECIIIFIWLLCTFVEGESHRWDAYTKGEKTFFFEKTLFCLVLPYACFLVALWCFELFLVSMVYCLCVGHVYILTLLCFIDCMF